jgi:hypothetical protein
MYLPKNLIQIIVKLVVIVKIIKYVINKPRSAVKAMLVVLIKVLIIFIKRKRHVQINVNVQETDNV